MRVLFWFSMIGWAVSIPVGIMGAGRFGVWDAGSFLNGMSAGLFLALTVSWATRPY